MDAKIKSSQNTVTAFLWLTLKQRLLHCLHLKQINKDTHTQLQERRHQCFSDNQSQPEACKSQEVIEKEAFVLLFKKCILASSMLRRAHFLRSYQQLQSVRKICCPLTFNALMPCLVMNTKRRGCFAKSEAGVGKIQKCQLSELHLNGEKHFCDKQWFYLFEF